MTFTDITILSIVQGITEFLPISSSGHLVLAPHIFSFPDQGLIMDLAVHIGTLLAVLVYYRKDVWQISIACLQFNKTTNPEAQRLGIFIGFATIPAIVVGLIIHKLFPEGIRSIHVITFTTIFYAILMGVADRFGKTNRLMKDMTFKSAMLIGCAQALALIPGTSRSGVTMTAARGLGFDRKDAARFSFLLSLPATAGAGLIGVLAALKTDNLAMGHDMLIAIAMTFITGILAISFLMKWIGRFGLMPYVIYRLLLGAALLVYAF